jgi:hypothetical protein
VKNGKRNEKIKRKRISCLVGPRGVFQPTRARLAAQLAQQRGDDGGGTALRCRAHMPARGGGLTGAGGNGGRGRSAGVRPAVEIRGGSPPWVRFCGGEVVVRHGRGQAITGVGSI